MIEYRVMRTMVFFDLPVEKKKQRASYQKFVKALKKLGFVMMQKSVYSKLDLDDRAADSTKSKVADILPKEGMVALLKITEKQYASIDYMLGESDSDVLSTDERNVIL